MSQQESAQPEVVVQGLNFEDALNQVLTLEGSLTEEQRASLSKVLFPDTHTTKIKLGEKDRELRPLTIKYARQLHAAALPFVRAATAAAESDVAFSLDDDIVNTLKNATQILASYYGWDDVQKMLEEEDFTTSELQNLVVRQQLLQGDNDFLLGPLRILIKVMQVREILQARVTNSHLKSSSSMQPS